MVLGEPLVSLGGFVVCWTPMGTSGSGGLSASLVVPAIPVVVVEVGEAVPLLGGPASVFVLAAAILAAVFGFG